MSKDVADDPACSPNVGRLCYYSHKGCRHTRRCHTGHRCCYHRRCWHFGFHDCLEIDQATLPSTMATRLFLSGLDLKSHLHTRPNSMRQHLLQLSVPFSPATSASAGDLVRAAFQAPRLSARCSEWRVSVSPPLGGFAYRACVAPFVGLFAAFPKTNLTLQPFEAVVQD